MSGWFPVNVGLRQRCVMSPWLVNGFMDGVVREENGCYLQMIQTQWLTKKKRCVDW